MNSAFKRRSIAGRKDSSVSRQKTALSKYKNILLFSLSLFASCSSRIESSPPPQSGTKPGAEKGMSMQDSGFKALNQPGPMRVVQVGDVKIAVYEGGNTLPQGDPVLLLHGLGEHAGYWSENTPSLIAAHRRVIVPDLAGHGRSDKPDRPHDMAWQAALMIGTLDALGIDEPVVVVGHSMGGQIALRMALSFSERVKRLVLISPAGIESFSPAESAWLKKVSTPSSLSNRSPSALRAHFQRNVFGRWGRSAEEHLQERLQLSKDPLFPAYIRSVVSSIHGMLDDPASRELERLSQPCYLLFGEEDRLIPNPILHGGKAIDIVKLAQAKIPNLREVVMLEGIGHMPQLEAPRRVERLILSASEPTADQSRDSARQHTSTQVPIPRKRKAMRPVLIKRYPNRRLYDTGRSAYITLDDLAEDLTRGVKVKVVDSKTEEDITQRVMLQAMLTDQHAHKLNCLPVEFLRTILQLEDPTMRSLFNHYVRVTLSSFSVAQGAMQQNIEILKRLAPSPTDLLQSIAGVIKPNSDQS